MITCNTCLSLTSLSKIISKSIRFAVNGNKKRTVIEELKILKGKKKMFNPELSKRE